MSKADHTEVDPQAADDGDDSEQLPEDLAAALAGVPERLRSMQVGGTWVGGFLFGATAPGGLCVFFTPGDLFQMAQMLVTPVAAYFTFRWAQRLDENPIRYGIWVGGVVCVMTVMFTIGFLMSLSQARFASGSFIPTALIVVQGIIAVCLNCLAVLYLRSIPLMIRYSHARIEYPHGIGSLWDARARRLLRQRLNSARLWSVLAGLGILFVPFLFFML